MWKLVEFLWDQRDKGDFDAGKRSVPGLCSSELGDSENPLSYVSPGEGEFLQVCRLESPSHGE
jgi:hypothetical protein